MRLFVRCKSSKKKQIKSIRCLIFTFSSDPRLQNSRLPNEAVDTSSRLVNLDFILRSIRSFVQVKTTNSANAKKTCFALLFSQDVLHYVIVAKLPNIYLIANEPYTG